ncbi:hypothetical protein LHP98_18970 [Rhodobacter sp. Har01]|uniref:hypothetical protein n=1 Tax=Rhodobacter sp. Har01 TaxID=2883999 RepID=UPI001D07E677|nr:hypothetical protein [Rhodobacter sp. Har01]MCB6180199.1 hypothetical protein [Rhodobacter sp. Har01]
MPRTVPRLPASVPPLDFEYKPFTAAILVGIIQRTGLPVEPRCFAFHDAVNTLNMAAVGHKQEQESKPVPTRHKQVQFIKRIGQRAEALRMVLPISDSSTGLFTGGKQIDAGTLRLIGSSMEALMQEAALQRTKLVGRTQTAEDLFGDGNAADALLRMREMLDLLVASCDRARAASLASDPEQKGTDPIGGFVEAACRVYCSLRRVDQLRFSRDPKTNKPTGPLIRFLDACCRTVLDERSSKTEEALADIVVRYRKRKQRAVRRDLSGRS